MATTTATITLSSSDLTGDVLALSQTATLTKAGLSTGLDQTSGVGRKTSTSTTAYVLVPSSVYSDDKAHKVYIRNTSSNSTEYFDLSLDTKDVGRLYGGDWAFFPYDGRSDIRVTPSVATSFTVEYFLIYEA